MDKGEEYRRNALDAIEYSERARTEADKASWLRIAAKWLALTPMQSPAASEHFVERVHAGTPRQA
jgi:hypothetical protein